MSPVSASLGHRQLFILPSRHGLMFVLLLLVLLFAAINYENGLAYGLTFLLASLANVSLVYSHRNLYRLQLAPAGRATACFAGDDAVFSIAINNPGGLTRVGIALETPRGRRRIGGNEFARVNIGSHGTAFVELLVPARRRGYLKLPPFFLSTVYPLGLAYCWSRLIKFDERCLVYPCPFGQRPLPLAGGKLGADIAGQGGEGDDFHALRDYRPGDSPRHIAWKALARGRGPYTKQFAGGATTVLLDWHGLTGLDTESRLSQLCAWVLDAEQQGMQYGLCLPTETLAPANGPEHEHRCLKALALYEDPGHGLSEDR